MGLIKLSAYPRSETGKNENRRLRAAGRTPAVIYGNERDNAHNLEIDTAELGKALAIGGRTPLFNLTIEGEDVVVTVLRELQQHPVSDEVLHVDLLEIPLNKPMTFEVSVDIQGDNKLMKGGDAVLEVVRRIFEVECLPRDLPDVAVIDISELEIGDTISVADISLENVTILTDGEETLVKLTPNTIVALEDEVVEGEEGEEGEEGVEGEEGAEGEEDAEAKDEKAPKGD